MTNAHVFKMEFLASTTGGVINLAPSGTNFYDLSNVPGQVGVFPTDSYGIYSVATTTATAQDIVIAAGSYMTTDMITPYLGGYQETPASKRIQLNLVTRFVHDIAHTGQQQKVAIGWDMSVTGDTADIGPRFFCGQTYTIFVQVLGDPAFQTFLKAMYNEFEAWGGCCTTGCATGCTSDYTDPVCIMLQWKDRMYQTPMWCPITGRWAGFILPKVYWNNSGVKTEAFSALDVQEGRAGVNTEYLCDTTNPETIVAGMEITVAYLDTTFGTCTWSYTDSYNISPAYIQATLKTQDFDPCAINTTINTSVPNMFTELQAPRQAKGVGNTVIKGLIESGNYRQELFADGNWTMSLRMREIEGNNPVSDVTTASGLANGNAGLFDKVVLEHQVPRKRNATSVYDVDYYIIIMHVPNGTNVDPYTNLISACLSAAGSNVTLETQQL